MKTRRDSGGRFVRNEEQTYQNEGFLQEMQGFANISYRFWRFLPLLLLLVIFWKYFQISDEIIRIMIEILCGKGCSCSCAEPAKKSGI